MKKLLHIFLCMMVMSGAVQAMDTSRPKDVQLLSEIRNFRTDVRDPMFFMALHHKLKTIKSLLESHVNPNTEYYVGGIKHSVLCAAVGSGHESVVRILLDNKASIDGRNGDGSPLGDALSNGHVSVMALLLERGASVEDHPHLFLHIPHAEQDKLEISGIDVCAALVLRHPHCNANMIVRHFGLYGTDRRLPKTRWFTYHADVKAYTEKVAEAVSPFSLDLVGIVAAYAACYHHVEGHPLKEDKPKSAEDLADLAKIVAILPTSERINKAVLERAKPTA